MLPPQRTELTFNVLADANLARIPTFKNKHGGFAHSMSDGSDWSPAQWIQAIIGELGEYANERKKYERGDLTAAEFAVKAAKELADVQTYLSILAMRCLDTPWGEARKGIDLGAATMEKFNEVSRRVGSPIVICSNGTDWVDTSCLPDIL